MERQQLQDIKMDQLTALDAFKTIGGRKLDTFETVEDLAMALKPYLMLTNPAVSQEPSLEAKIKALEKEKEELQKKLDKKIEKPEK